MTLNWSFNERDKKVQVMISVKDNLSSSVTLWLSIHTASERVWAGPKP
jgi:hypothetical protein